ncbi:MAG: hypothetical protein LR015_01785 [Verrucomicrobia bacterium]|nr:hypothetical protein [Verrucomicrobiota bacterium]
MKYLPLYSLLSVTCALAAVSFVTAQVPTDNPAASFYGPGEYPIWTDQLRWDNVIDMSTYTNGDNHFERFENARDELYAQGGGVLYYPAGIWEFELPDMGYGAGMGPMSRGLMLRSGVVIRGADLTSGHDQAVIRATDNPNDPLFANDVTFSLDPGTVFVFPRVNRGTCPVTLQANAAGTLPADWSLIGLMRPEGGTVADVNNVGVVNVRLESGVITFGFHQEWAQRRVDGWWRANQAKIDWPAGAPEAETWGGHTPTGMHYLDALIGKTNPGNANANPVAMGSGRLIMGVRLENAAAHADMLRPHASNSPVDAFAHFRFAGRLMAYGSNVFVANNVIAKPTQNFVFRQLHSGNNFRNMLFDHANGIGIDINKSGFGGNHNSATVIGPGVGMNAPNVIVRDNWVFNRGNKNFEIAGDGVVILNNHAEKYMIHRTIYAGYITNPQVFGVDSTSPTYNPMTSIDLGGVSFDGWSWQTATSASDYMNRGYDIGGRNLWMHHNSVVNPGSIGNDGEGIISQEHNRVGVYSWAWTYNISSRVNKGPGTIGQDGAKGWIGSYNQQQFGFLLLGNASVNPAQVGTLDSSRLQSPETGLNYLLDVSISRTGLNGRSTLGIGSGANHGGPLEPVDGIIVDHEDAVSAPVDVVAEIINDTAVRITWADTATNELGFRVERSIDGGDWHVIAYRPRSNLLPTLTTVQDPLELIGSVSIVAQPTMVSELNPQLWMDHTAPLSKANSIEYRVVAINSADDLSTGVSAVAVLELGSSVLEPMDSPILTVSSTGIMVTLQESTEGQWYQLEMSSNLQSDSWISVGEAIQGTGAELNLEHESPVSSEEARFYRIRTFR